MKNKFIKVFFAIFLFLSVLVITHSFLKYLFPKKHSNYVEYYAGQYNIDENLVYAIIKCESNFKEDSVSHAGAIGLMQITPDTLSWAALKAGDTEVTESALYNPSTNIKYGCYIYSLFYNEFADRTVSLASYNAGRGNVLSWLSDSRYSDDGILLKDIPFEETENYVKKVQNVKRIYDLIY